MNMSSYKKGDSRGFTLVEVMVALAVGTVLLLGLMILFASNSRNQGELERGLRQIENARFSLDVLSEDLLHAGYYSDLNPGSFSALTYTTPTVCPSNLAELGWNFNASPVVLPVPVQGIDAATSAPCLLNRLPNTQALAIHRAETGAPITTAALTAGGAVQDLYVQISRCGSDPRRAVVSSSVGDFTLRLPDCSAANDALRRVVHRVYFVASCNRCGASSDGIPTLKRVEWRDGRLVTTTISEGVENLQLEFGFDVNADGQADVLDLNTNGVPDRAYVTLGARAPLAGTLNWQDAVGARVHMLVRSAERTAGHTDGRTFALGPDVSVVAPADGHKRTLVSATVRLTNVGGRRE